MIRIANHRRGLRGVTATLPLGSIDFERHPADDGQRLVWLEPHVVNKLRVVRRPGESYRNAMR